MEKNKSLLGFCIGIIFGAIFVSIVVYYFMKEYCWNRTCKKKYKQGDGDFELKRRLTDLRQQCNCCCIAKQLTENNDDEEELVGMTTQLSLEKLRV